MLSLSTSQFTSSPFSYHGVDFYSNITEQDIPFLLNSGYQYLVFDMGSVGETDFSEFLRCDSKLVLGSLAPWKANSWEKFFCHIKQTNLGEGFQYIVQTGKDKDISQFSRTHLISKGDICPLPFIKNPFKVEKEHLLFFQDLLFEF